MRLPSPPRGVPYRDFEDALSRAILEANGVGADRDALIDALGREEGPLRAAAARTLGALGERAAIEPLRALTTDESESAAVEAAFALARLGERDEGVALLRRWLEVPFEGSVAPLLAAGALARLGDAAGAPVVERALASGNELLRMVAAKQLYFLAELEHAPVDVDALFERAVADPHARVAETARSQLRELRGGDAR